MSAGALDGFTGSIGGFGFFAGSQEGLRLCDPICKVRLERRLGLADLGQLFRAQRFQLLSGHEVGGVETVLPGDRRNVPRSSLGSGYCF